MADSDKWWCWASQIPFVHCGCHRGSFSPMLSRLRVETARRILLGGRVIHFDLGATCVDISRQSTSVQPHGRGPSSSDRASLGSCAIPSWHLAWFLTVYTQSHFPCWCACLHLVPSWQDSRLLYPSRNRGGPAQRPPDDQAPTRSTWAPPLAQAATANRTPISSPSMCSLLEWRSRGDLPDWGCDLGFSPCWPVNFVWTQSPESLR